MFATLLLLAAATFGQANEMAPDAIETEVRRLVRDLNARELSTRDAAEQRLLELGTGALEHLPELTDRTPAEVRQRVGRVRLRLERAQAEQTAQASQVTLAEESISVSQAFEEIERQTGNAILDYRREFGQEPVESQLSVNFEDTPFWEAFDQVLDQAGLSVYPYASERGVAVVNRTATQARRHGQAAYAGAFRIEAVQMTAQRDLRDAQNRSLSLNLEVAWEPRLSPIALHQSLSTLKVIDDTGNELEVEGFGVDLEAPVTHGAIAAELEIPLSPPPRSVKQIASLQGELMAVLPGRAETFRFTDLSGKEPVEYHKAGVTVTLDRVRKNNEIWEFRVRVGFAEPGQALESHRDWMFHNEAYLETPDGQSRQPDGLETTLQTDHEFGVAYLFDLPDGPADHTLVYRTPSLILQVPIRFELNNLELP